MKHSVIMGIMCSALLLSGCQSLNWFAKNQSKPDRPVAKAENIREVPWTWRKKKPPESKTELPPEFAQKMEDAKRRSNSPKTADEWIAEGSEQEVARNFSAAKKAYDEALLIDPVNATAHHRLGILADMRQEYVVAQDHYEAALRQKPHDANLLSDLGYSHHLRGNVQQSKRYLLQALDIERQHRQALKNLGTLYASQGWYGEAAVAFRHYRSEAEAQQLLSQYFPGGNQAAQGDVAHAGPQRTAPPMPSDDELNPDSLKAMSQAEIMQLMQRQKLAAQRDRDQKLQQELRPPLQNLTAQGPDSEAQLPPAGIRRNAEPAPPASTSSPWGPAAAVADANSAQPSNTDPFANRGALPANGANSPGNAGKPAPQNTPFWNGAGLQQNAAPPAPAGNWPSANATASASMQAPWWGDRNMPSDTTSGRQFAPGGQNPLNNGMPPQDYARREGQPPSQNSDSLSRQAYQLGMSAGPGTMFPTFGNPSVNVSSLTNAGPAAGSGATTENWSHSTSPSGYSEMRPTAAWEQPANSEANSQWQDAPTRLASPSPSDNWNSPTTVPWPESSAVQQATGIHPEPRNSSPKMPVISPGTSPWGNAPNGSPRPGNSSGQSGAEFDRAAENGTGVVPAWYDSRPSDGPPPYRGRSGTNPNATSVQQWPYAPK